MVRLGLRVCGGLGLYGPSRALNAARPIDSATEVQAEMGVAMARGKRGHHWTFNPPPGWPTPPQGWQPQAGWEPAPEWPPAPPGWAFWVPEIATSPIPIRASPSPEAAAPTTTVPVEVTSRKLSMRHTARGQGSRYVAVARQQGASFTAYGMTRPGAERRAVRQLRKMLGSTRTRTV